MAAARLTIRRFRKGDERAIARLLNEYAAGFVGPTPVTPGSWKAQYRRQGWCAPSIRGDPDCARVAVRGGRIVGYSITDRDPEWGEDFAMLQELCVVRDDDAEETAQALMADAEELARKRGKTAMMVMLSNEDGVARRAAESLGFDIPEEGGAVFMATVTDLAAFLRELEPELERRLAASPLAGWEGIVRLRSEGMTGSIRAAGGKVKAGARGRAAVTAEIAPEALPRLLLAQLSVGEAFLQDWLSVVGKPSGVRQALALLDALFPRLPLWVPRGQEW